MTARADADRIAESLSPARRYMILATVVLGASLYSTALLTTSTILPQMQGAMSATQDEIAWAMTFNILATAIVTPMTGWLTARFGARNVMLWGMVAFTVATAMCGLCNSLETLVVWRIVQGAVGAPIVPLSQTIALDTFPRRQHGMVLSIYGMAVGVAPVVGPTLGGYLAEIYDWRWTFFMMVPVGIVSVLAVHFVLIADKLAGKRQLDWTGFLALSVAMGAVQLVLARGVRLDWLESTEIIVEIVLAVIAFYVFVAHCLTAKTPFLDLRLLKDRNYSIGLILVTLYGMLNFTPMVLLPPLLQQHAGFPDALVGLVIGMRGAGMTVGFLVAGFMSRIDPRIGMIVGFTLQAASGLSMLTFDLNVDMSLLVANSMLQGFAVGIIWVPLSVVTFDTLPQSARAEAASVLHLLRNIGSSFFISLSIAEIVRATGANYSRMTEMVTPYNPALSLPAITGAWDFETAAGLAKVAREINRQATMIGYLNAFVMYTAASVAAIALVLVVRKRQPPLPAA